MSHSHITLTGHTYMSHSHITFTDHTHISHSHITPTGHTHRSHSYITLPHVTLTHQSHVALTHHSHRSHVTHRTHTLFKLRTYHLTKAPHCPAALLVTSCRASLTLTSKLQNGVFSTGSALMSSRSSPHAPSSRSRDYGRGEGEEQLDNSVISPQLQRDWGYRQCSR